MKLTYRGVDYEGTPALEVTEGEIGGTYRGQQWKSRYVRHIPEPAPVNNLRYRGIAYRTGNSTTSVPKAVEQPLAARLRQTLVTRNKREVLDELTSNHMKNICRSLEHRLAVAKARGDDNLIQLLEAESKQMACPLR
jgi:hypothetical protein